MFPDFCRFQLKLVSNVRVELNKTGQNRGQNIVLTPIKRDTLKLNNSVIIVFLFECRVGGSEPRRLSCHVLRTYCARNTNIHAHIQSSFGDFHKSHVLNDGTA